MQVVFGAHEASEHQVQVTGRSAKPKKDFRMPFHRDIHAWRTPFAEQASVEAVLVYASDLWIESLDERHFLDQFTPGDPEEAYEESRGSVWSRLRAPFITWEVVETPPSLPLSGEEEHDLIQAADIVDTEERGRFQMIKEYVLRKKDVLFEREEELVEEVEGTWSAPHVSASVQPLRLVVAFLGMVVLVALPAGAVSWSRSLTHSAGSLQALAQNVSSEADRFSFADIASWSKRFHEIETLAEQLQSGHRVAFSLAQLIPSTRTTAETVDALLTAAQEGSAVASLLSQGIAKLSVTDGALPDERLLRFQQYMEEAEPSIERLLAAVRRITPEALPEEYQPRVREIRSTLASLEPLLRDTQRLSDMVLALIGHHEPRTYLIVFQNEAELRPSGGFMGSFAELTLDRGAIKHLNVPGGGPYDLRSQLTKRWRPPEPLQLVGARWEFQDANWSPDFGETARTINTFWSESGQPTLDGIIAVNSSILPKLMKLTGPITLDTYGKTVTADNVLFETQKAVELEYDREKNTPKAFVADLNKEVLARLQELPANRWSEVALLLARSLEEKETQVWLTRADEQDTARSFGWTGEWEHAPEFDRFAMIGANIAGQKSDRMMVESLVQNVSIKSDGTITETIEAKRTHTGTSDLLFYGAQNVQYARWYVPASTLLGAAGFQAPNEALFERSTEQELPFEGVVSTTRLTFDEATLDVAEEASGMILGGWLQTKPQSSTRTELAYTLDRRTSDMAQALRTSDALDEATDAYVLDLYAQSGKARAHTLRIDYPPSWKVLRSSAGLEEDEEGVLILDIPALTRDTRLFVLFDRS